MVFSSRSGGGSTMSSALVIALASIIAPVTAASCSGYTTTGPAGNQTFVNYAFYDFRHLGDQLSGTPVYSEDPDFDNGQFALSTSSYFNSTVWQDPWSSLNTKKLANRTQSQYVDMVYTPLNVAIVKDNSTKPDGETVLSLTTNRLEKYSASAQIQTNKQFLHASVRISARMMGPAGACGAFFLYGDDQNESDTELLTNDTSTLLHATNHPSQDAKGNIIAGASSTIPIPAEGSANGTATSNWSDWNEWRMDWLPDRTQWIINGVLAVDKTYSPPKLPSFLGINMWSNGGSWTGNMTIGETATLQIRWVEIVYNTTSDPSISSGSSCTINDMNDGANGASNSGALQLSSSSLVWLFILVTSLWSLL